MESPASAALVASEPRPSWRLAIACGLGILALLAGVQFAPVQLNPGLMLAEQASSTSLLLTLVAVGWAACGRRPVTERLGLRTGRADLGVVMLLAIGLLGLSHALDQVINALDLRATSALAQIDAAVGAEPEASWPWLLLGLGLAPGIGEEIFFRGLLQRGLRRWLGPIGGLLATAVLFGSFHGDLVHAAGAFGLGLYLGGIAEITGGTRAAIGCHIVNNLAAVSGLTLPAQQALPPLALAATGFAVAGLALWVAWRRVDRPRDGLQPPAGLADP
jgi:membrane protease YdiL (CAAX protease family)